MVQGQAAVAAVVGMVVGMAMVAVEWVVLGVQWQRTQLFPFSSCLAMYLLKVRGRVEWGWKVGKIYREY